MSIQQIINRLQARTFAAAKRGDRTALQRGFSLVEVMIAMVVSAIVLVGVFAFSGVTSATSDQFTRGVKIQQGLEAAMTAVGNDVRLAGLGFAPLCSELRIIGAGDQQFINPTSGQIPTAPGARDGDTEELYWVLRDGFQAHWRSSESNGGGVEILGDTARPTSAALGNSADSFDVAFGEPGFVASKGAFHLEQQIAPGDDKIIIRTGTLGPNVMDNTDPLDLNSIRQLFPPGSFLMLMVEDSNPDPARVPDAHIQCALVQITGDVQPDGGGSNLFAIPTNQISGFNKDLARLAGPAWPICGNPMSACPNVGMPNAAVVPMGRFRWSRYEIDYTVDALPYLVRTDLISWVPGDPTFNPGTPYPSCGIDPISGDQTCRLPQLHLPAGTTNVEQGPRAMRVPIAPMVEDLQVSVGCDPQDLSGEAVGATPLQAEKGARDGIISDNVPNRRVDEYALTNERNIDEWVGNSVAEVEAPDCVFWGSGESHSGAWPQTGRVGDRFLDGGWRISPEVIRVTLLGKSEFRASGSMASNTDIDSSYNRLFSIEDRPAVPAILKGREYRTLTEVFRPKNITYRPPAIP